MRRSRGNIILTALFVSIFLFFLSVALIWTNRQDIALSLSMEHKLKAQSAARTAAYEAYYRLRKDGTLSGFQTGTLDSGATYEVELVTLEPNGKRGEVLLVQARGRSGPVTSYLTLHLLDTRIAGKANENDPRVLFFPGSQVAAEDGTTTETEVSPDPAGAAEDDANALFGEFTLEVGGPGVISSMQANAGPAFVAEGTSIEPPSFEDTIPVHGGPALKGWGPVEVVAPEYPQSGPGRPTTLRILKYSGNEFTWKEIDPPTDLGDPRPQGLTELFEMSAPESWTISSVMGLTVVNEEDESVTKAFSFSWTEEKPPTTNAEDIGTVTSSAGEPIGELVEWKKASVQQKFETRGAIYPVGDVVYSLGWHYLYLPHDGSTPDEPDVLDGSTLTRWPCVLKYSEGGGWQKAWTGLKESGAVVSELQPDPDILLVTSAGKIYSATPPTNGLRTLLALESNSVKKVGDPFADGRLILYRDEPYLVVPSSSTMAFRNLLRDGEDVDFATLPIYLPELSGEVVDVTGTEMLVLGMEGGYQGEPLDSTKRLTYTARPQTDISYTLPPGAGVAVDGEDLWAVLNVAVDASEPTFEKAYVTPPYPDGVRQTLARYDGERWHILPNGLRACLRNDDLRAPSANVVAAIYPGLPIQKSRYTIIAEDTDPF
ncbi:MAG: hypothetical protein KC800_07920 [Candidatus Eremiobacteraeota bacterium]|nr:hypothetical protein [Candidatus Eremiobacteraeota bacterium]